MNDAAAFVIRSFPFLLLLPLLSELSILQILPAPPSFQRIFEFLEADSGQGLLFHAGGYLYQVAFLPYIAFLIQLSRYNAAQGRRKFLLISITFPLLCAAAAVSVPPVYPAGYGQPAAVNCPVRFSALPVPSYLSSCLFHWPLPLLPTSHSPPTGH